MRGDPDRIAAAKQHLVEALEDAAMSEVVDALAEITAERGFPYTNQKVRGLAYWIHGHPETSTHVRRSTPDA